MKQKYYRLTNMDKIDAQYKILLGENSNGKSYAVKERVVIDAYKNGVKFVYMRRYELESKPKMIEQYFSDCPVYAITGGEYSIISCWQGQIYLANMENNKVVRGVAIGWYVYLSGYEHFKSMPYPNVGNVIFEEFVTLRMYLDNEPSLLQMFISIIARRRKITVYMVANTISRVCPYFVEWELRNVPKQKQGTIDIYEHDTDNFYENGEKVVIKIAVEFCENSGKNSKMFFGKVAETITGGVWKSEEQPHLSESLMNYNVLYELIISHMGFSFILQLISDKNGALLLYCYPYTYKRKINRIITQVIDESPMVTNNFLDIKPEIIMKKLLCQKKVFFSDNMTGTDFWNVINNLF